jgi:hypothetical protein
MRSMTMWRTPRLQCCSRTTTKMTQPLLLLSHLPQHDRYTQNFLPLINFWQSSLSLSANHFSAIRTSHLLMLCYLLTSSLHARPRTYMPAVHLHFPLIYTFSFPANCYDCEPQSLSVWLESNTLSLHRARWRRRSLTHVWDINLSKVSWSTRANTHWHTPAFINKCCPQEV